MSVEDRTTGPRGPFYAVRVGKGDRPCVVSTWPECQKEVHGVSGAVHKKFHRLADAMAFANGGEPVASRKRAASPREKDRGAPQTKAPASKTTEKEVVVFTDGACPGQHDIRNKDERRSGCGVWFGHGDPRNISVRNPFPPHTSNRAELGAALLALRAHLDGPDAEKPLHIMTDSGYVRDGMTKYMTSWVRRGFANVKNADLWRPLREEAGKSTRFTHVRGHQGIEGNEEADALARSGVYDE